MRTPGDEFIPRPGGSRRAPSSTDNEFHRDWLGRRRRQPAPRRGEAERIGDEARDLGRLESAAREAPWFLHGKRYTLYCLKAEVQRDKQMVHMLFDDALLERIDAFWHDNRFRARAEAVHWLIQAAVDKKLAPSAAAK
jgi:hypothetical protein